MHCGRAYNNSYIKAVNNYLLKLLRFKSKYILKRVCIPIVYVVVSEEKISKSVTFNSKRSVSILNIYD